MARLSSLYGYPVDAMDLNELKDGCYGITASIQSSNSLKRWSPPFPNSEMVYPCTSGPRPLHAPILLSKAIKRASHPALRIRNTFL